MASGRSGLASITGERLPAVDALRGAAVLGIAAVNIWFFAYPELLLGARPAEREHASLADHLVSLASTLLFEGKAYLIFSFLFGLAFVAQFAAAQRDGSSGTSRSVRRFAGLAILGVLHGLLLFAGDILLAYAVLGFVLLGLRSLSDRAALLVAGGIYLSMSLLLLGAGLVLVCAHDAGGASGAAADALTGAVAAESVRSEYVGGPASYLGFQLSAYAAIVPSVLLGQAPMALAAFLAGLVAGRRDLVRRVVDGRFSAGVLLVIGVISSVAGLACSGVAAVLRWGLPGTAAAEVGAVAGAQPLGADALAGALLFAGGPVQAFGLVVLMLLLRRRSAMARLFAPLSAAGRLSLTNYLGQSAVFALVFSGLGLGLAGEISPAAAGALVLGLWIVQLLASSAWMRLFRAGPLEALLRAWTYVQPPRWRRGTEGAAGWDRSASRGGQANAGGCSPPAPPQG